MRGNNLNIEIVGDSSKFTAELKLAEAAARKFGKELKAASDEAVRTGDRSKVDQLAPQFDAASRSAAGLKRQIRGIADETDGATRSMRSFIREGAGTRRVVTQLVGSANSLQNIAALLGGLAGGFAGAFAATAVVGAVEWMVKSLGDISKNLSEIQGKAREMGQKPIVVQAFRDMATAAGQAAEEGDKILAAQSKFIAKQAVDKPFEPFKALRGGVPGPDVVGDTKVLRGGTGAGGAGARMLQAGPEGFIQEWRNGIPVLKTIDDLLKPIRDKMAEFPDTQEGNIQKLLALNKGFAELARQLGPTSQRLNELSKELNGVPAATALEILPGQIEKLNQQLLELQNRPRGITDSVEAANKQMLQQKDAVSKALGDPIASYQLWLLGIQTASNQWLAGFLTETLPAWKAGVDQFFADMQSQAVSGWQATMDLFKGIDDQMLNDMLAAWNGFWASVGQLSSNVFDWIAAKAQAVGQAIRSALGGIGGAFGDPSIPALPPGQFARGGTVPGSGSGDTVPAMLTPGEFVQRRASVNYYGAGIMRALNARAIPRDLFSRIGFAMGGLVGPSPAMAFAGGGSVGGVPVHLHLGGNSFALSGSEGVVGALVVEARRQQIRSAGVKPSWYGGRPGGR